MSRLPSGHELRVYDDPEALMAGSAALLLETLGDVGTYPRLVVAGGSTPVRLYEALCAYATDPLWKRLRVTFSDERAVSANHEDSNFGMAERTLIRPARNPSCLMARSGDSFPDAKRNLPARLSRGLDSGVSQQNGAAWNRHHSLLR